eukprot:Tbor_TRINITY_DN5425_c2_g9::TRINITY_DN5425_c2_g9_i1::g.24320::m.24320
MKMFSPNQERERYNTTRRVSSPRTTKDNTPSDAQKVYNNNNDNNKELNDLRHKMNQMNEKLIAVELELSKKVQENRDIGQEMERTRIAHQDDTVLLQRKIVELETKNRSINDMRISLERRVRELETDLAASQHRNEITEEVIGRQQGDLSGLVVSSEREIMEKQKVKDAFREYIAEINKEGEALRKRKEHYKKQAIEEKHRGKSNAKSLEYFKNDRENFTETIKAQQIIIAEKMNTIEDLKKELDAYKGRDHAQCVIEGDRLETIQILNESIRQYQDASLKFMSDITAKDREI